MSEIRLNTCGKCKKPFGYAPVKCPLGPPSFSPDPRYEAIGLDIKNGVVEYVSLCLICAREWLSKVSEGYLVDGTVEDIKVPEEVKKAPVENPKPVTHRHGCLWKCNPLNWF